MDLHVKHCKVCTEVKHEGKCLKGVKLDCKHDCKCEKKDCLRADTASNCEANNCCEKPNC